MTRPFDEAKYNALLNGLEISEVKLSEVLAGDATLRVDSEFFRKHLLENHRLLEGANGAPLKQSLESLRSFGAYSLCNEINFVPDGIPFVRCMDMREGAVNFDNVQTVDGASNKLLWKSEITKGTVLLSMSGSIGNIALATDSWKYPINSNQDIAKIRVNSSMNPAYLYAFFLSHHGRIQLDRFKVGSVQQHIFMWQIENLLIPGFSGHFEKAIANVVSKIEHNKRSAIAASKEAATTLLELTGLDSPLPEEKNTSSKTFSESFALSGRLDAEFYQPKYDELFERIHANAEYVKTIQELETFNARGLQPVYEEFGALPVINSRHILEDGLDYENFKRTGSGFWESQKRARVKRNDILVYTTGANIGRSQPYLADKPALASNHVNVLRIKGEDPLYVAFVMNSLIGRMQTERLSAGTAQAELYPKDISRFVIPFVSKKKQRKIVELLVEAREKKAESFQCLEKAKRAVEIAIEKGEEAAMAYLEGRTYVEQAVVHELGEQASYFSIDAVRRWLADQKMSYKPDTVKTYLSRQKKAGKIFDAGRGWYSSLAEPYQLDTAPVEKLVGELKEAFPLLDFACWSTAQLNDLLRHQLAKHVRFAYVERDAMGSVADWLRNNGYRPCVNPGKKGRQSFVIEENSVVVLPLASEVPSKEGFALIEKILTDVLSDASGFSIINIPEFIERASEVICSQRIDMAKLIRYSSRRKVDLPELFKEGAIH